MNINRRQYQPTQYSEGIENKQKVNTFFFLATENNRITHAEDMLYVFCVRFVVKRSGGNGTLWQS